MGEWAELARELPNRIGDWMERLSSEGVRGADLVFACIRPAMEVYSRYSRVEDAEGREVPLGGNPEAARPHERGFLAYVWEMVGRAALNQVLGTGRIRPTDTAGSALEEDARLTALFLWTKAAGLAEAPKAKVAVFVGNTWDPQPGRETPWIDIARQIAGEQGVAALGPAAKTSPPGTDALNRLIDLAGGPVLLLFDEVLNSLTRHKKLAEPMHAFLHNVMRGFIGQKGRAAVVSLPRSEVEMTPFDQQWQDKITKVVGAVAQQLVANDEAEISEVVRRRLFENLGKDSTRRAVAKAYADWCFERRAQLPPEVTSRDAGSEATVRETLRERFELCYPFHPATLTVFQRKWSTVPQFQQTRGTLAMLAQWISWAYRDGYQRARREALVTLGSAPLQVPEFRGSILGQLGEQKLAAAIDRPGCQERNGRRGVRFEVRLSRRMFGNWSPSRDL